MNSIFSVLHLVITSCRETEISASSSTQWIECFHCVSGTQISRVFGVIDIFVYIRTLNGWVIIHSTISQFSSFIRTAFYKAAYFIYLLRDGSPIGDRCCSLAVDLHEYEWNQWPVGPVAILSWSFWQPVCVEPLSRLYFLGQFTM